MKPTGVDAALLDRECEALYRYLFAEAPNDYVKRKYREAHLKGPLAQKGASTGFDEVLVRMAVMNRWMTKLIDAHTRIFRPRSLIRKKLILILAIAESSAPVHRCLDFADAVSFPVLVLRSFERCSTFALALIVGTALVLPLELAARRRGKFITLSVPRHG